MTVDGQAVIVAVLVESTVDVVNWVVSTSVDAFDCPVTDAPRASVIGQTVVETAIVSVVTYVVLSLAGQFGTVVGHAVIVAVLVEKIVDVVDPLDADAWEDRIPVAAVDLEV